MNTITVILLVIAIIAIAAAIWMYLLARRTRSLRSRFGPEYQRTVEAEHGRTRRAERVLEERQKRVSKLNIRNLTSEERDRFTADWRRVQERFVDDPRGAAGEADTLVTHALEARNYPTSDFEQRAADISVEYPNVVENYRIAHEIAKREPAQVSTEDLRKAMQHYRSLFEELVGTPVAHHTEVYK